MKHEINIYGDIVAFKWYNDGTEYDRADLNTAIDALDLKEGDELVYNIHTYGGCTTTAFSMYNKLKRVKDEKKITLTSRADGFCASSGVILLLAADKKIGSKFLKPFVHNAWTFAGGNKEEIKKVYESLEAVDDAIAELYAEETTITKEEALQFMNESRDLTLDECIKYGFYTELENVKVVEAENAFNSAISRRRENKDSNNLINNKMDKNSKETERKTILDRISKFLGVTENKIVFTADNSELDFYELGSDETPVIGSKAKFDGKAAGDSQEGKYTLASGEIYRFEGEELKEITPAAEDKKEDEAENALQVENDSLKSEIENLKKELGTLKTAQTELTNSMAEATSIIKAFKDIKSEDTPGDTKRDPKPKSENKKRELFKNLN